MKAKSAEQLTALEWTALAVIGRRGAGFRQEVEVGKQQPVDVLVRIKGTVDVYPEGESVRKDQPSAVELLASVFRQLDERDGFDDGDSMMKRLVEIAGMDAEERPEPDECHLEQAAKVLGAFTTTRTVTRSGQTRGYLEVGLVRPEELPRATAATVYKFTRQINLDDDDEPAKTEAK